ncbi:MAG: hypothetical protein V2B19_02190, partial [Pseudomonadota bacterium]
MIKDTKTYRIIGCAMVWIFFLFYLFCLALFYLQFAQIQFNGQRKSFFIKRTGSRKKKIPPN